MHNETPPAGSLDRWFYKTPQGKKGPVDAGCLRELLAAGELPEDTRVWQDGMDAWLVVTACEPFAEVLRDRAWRAACVGRPTENPRVTRFGVGVGILSVAIVLVAAAFFLSRTRHVTVSGYVTVGGEAVSAGTIILSAAGGQNMGGMKPGVGELAPDGRFVIRLRADGPSRWYVRYSSPVLPPLSEAASRASTPRYFGFVPRPEVISLGVNRESIEIQLVPARPPGAS
jgi:hypothetical protein